MAPLLVMTNVPDRTVAERIAETLVGERLVACANVLADTHSVYRWEGAVEQASEVTILLKTTAQRYAALEMRLAELHPYELPEIIAVPITQGLRGYLDWVEQSSAAS